jgi:hypothetical protein
VLEIISQLEKMEITKDQLQVRIFFKFFKIKKKNRSFI